MVSKRMTFANLVAGATSVALAVFVEKANADLSSAAIADGIEASRAKVLNVHIQDFSTTLQHDVAGMWQDVPGTMRGEAWFNGKPGSKGRIRFEDHILPNDQNPPAWINQRIDVGY